MILSLKPKNPTIRSLATLAIACIAMLTYIVGSSVAHADIIDLGTAGLDDPASVITFSEVEIGDTEQVTDQFAGLGVTFVPNMNYRTGDNPDWQNVEGPNLRNGEPEVNPFTIKFVDPQTAATFNAIAQPPTPTTITAKLNGAVVESFETTVSIDNPNNFFGFTGIEFDEIEVEYTAETRMRIDNLQFGVSGGDAPTLLLDFGNEGGNSNGTAEGWVGINNLVQDEAQDVGGGVTLTALDDGFNPNNTAAPGTAATFDGIEVPAEVRDDYLFKINDAAGTEARIRIDGLPAGAYSVTLFEGRTTDANQVAKLWVGEEPAAENTGSFANGSVTLEVTVVDGEPLWYKHLEDNSGGISGMIIRGLGDPPENYQDAVLAMAPNYYYELNETSTAGGAVDSTGNADPGVYNGDYANGPMVGAPGPLEVFDGIAVPGVGGAANLSHASNNAGHITLGDGNDYGANAITVAMFLKAGPAEGGDRIFTNNLTDPTKSFQIVAGNNGLVLAVDPTQAGADAERTLYLEDNSGPDRRLINADSGWFHIIASTSGATGAERAANFRLWVNGVDRTGNLQPDSVGWGTDTGMAKIGGRRDNAGDLTTHSGAQDEVAIWLDRVLTPEDAQNLWQAAITAPPIDADSDGDGMADDWEIEHFGDLSRVGTEDEDEPAPDGLTNKQEHDIGTDPNDNDSDDDGLLDGVESNTGIFVGTGDTGTDPLNADSDGDGLSDGDEVNTHETGPLDADSDGDGIGDGTEVAQGADPLDGGDVPEGIAELHTLSILPSGNYVFLAGDDAFEGYVHQEERDGEKTSWLLVGRGRDGWEFDTDGQGSVRDVITGLGTPDAFSPAMYSDDLINALLDASGVDLTEVEIRISRAANPEGTAYSEVRWRPIDQATWRGNFDDPEYAVEHEVVDGAGLPDMDPGVRTDGNTKDIALSGNGGSRVFTFPWGTPEGGGHLGVQGFSYGQAVANGANDDTSFLWENADENHALPYTELYIRIETEFVDPARIVSSDADGDGILDILELDLVGNLDDISAGDDDGDGLNSPDEVLVHRTDPLLPDTDGDTLNDGDEIANSTDPNNDDTDNDGLTDAVETNTGVFVDANDTGTDPNNPDTDGGLAPDGFEVQEGTDPHDPADDPIVIVQPSFIPINNIGAAAGYEPDFDNPGLDYQENHYNGRVILANNAQNNYDVHTSGDPEPDDSQQDLVPYLDHGGGGDTISSNNLDFITGGDNFTVRVNGYIDFTLAPTGTYNIHIGADDTNLFVLDTPDGPVSGQHNCCAQNQAFSIEITVPGYYPIDNVFGEQDGGDWTDLGISGGDIVGIVALGDVDAGSPPVYSITFDQTDSEPDGMPDAYELAFAAIDNLGQLTADGDFDNDGLLDPEEFDAGTNPTEADTDGDGLTDNVETGTGTYVGPSDTGTSPTQADTDGDGLTDGVESNTRVFVDANDTGTDPNDTDTDGDEFSDGTEIALGTDPTNPQDKPTGGTTLLTGEIVEFFGPDDLHLDPSCVVIAVDVFGNDDATINGVEFLTAGQTPGVGVVEKDGVMVTTTAAHQIDNWAAEAPSFTGADQASADNLALVMQDIRWDGAPVLVDIKGLSPGTTYELQLLFNEGADRNRQWDIAVNGELAVDTISSEGFAPTADGEGGTVWTPDNSFAYVGVFDSTASGEINVEMVNGLGGQPQQPGSDGNAILQGVILHLAGPAFNITEYTRNADNTVDLTWESKPGLFYDVEASTDLSPGSWEPFMVAIAAEPDPAIATSISVQGSADASMQYLRVVQVPPPPLLETSFEDGMGDWTVGGDGTLWEFGAPTTGPGAANSGTGVAATGLTADYAEGTMTQLRTPVIDPAGVRGFLKLDFWQYVEANDGEGGQISILEADGTLIQTLEPLFLGGEAGNSTEWTEANFRLTNPGRPFIVQFEFLSGDDGDPNNGTGWLIDDVRIGK
ncbi:MAG: hypothetical protein ACI8TX_001989 [Hyphomicrobiaceae bacterium]|jgi:hypothetical protein